MNWHPRHYLVFIFLTMFIQNLPYSGNHISVLKGTQLHSPCQCNLQLLRCKPFVSRTISKSQTENQRGVLSLWGVKLHLLSENFIKLIFSKIYIILRISYMNILFVPSLLLSLFPSTPHISLLPPKFMISFFGLLLFYTHRHMYTPTYV